MAIMRLLAEQLSNLCAIGDCTLLTADICQVAVGVVKDNMAALSAEERAHIARAAAPRKSSYSTGRYLAKRALAELGVPALSIPTHVSRRPIWPAGVAGSITHSRCYAIAIVCDKSRFAGIGIDLEVAGRVAARTAAKVTTADERAAGDGNWPQSVYTANFCAKEAVFKAVNPIVGLMVGFKEVEITWLEAEHGFVATYVGPNRKNAIIDGGRGTLFSLDGHIGALFWVEA